MAPTFKPGRQVPPVGLLFPADPDYPSNATQLAVLTYQFALPDGVVFNGFSVGSYGSSGEDTILWLHAKNTTSSTVSAGNCALMATVMFIRE